VRVVNGEQVWRSVLQTAEWMGPVVLTATEQQRRAIEGFYLNGVALLV